MATFFVPADSPYNDSCLNLFTTATATKACPQNNISTTASFFQPLIPEKKKTKFDP